MRDIPLDAKVRCTDGSAGRSSYVIINPATDQVTHFVVRQNGIRRTERLVPVSLVEETAPNTIHLRCTRDELRTMEPFIGHYIDRQDRPRYDQGTYLPYPRFVPHENMLVKTEFKRIPRGELAVHRGAHVQATNGHVGRVDEFLVDPSDHHVTHLILREGHLLNQRDVTIPGSAIGRVASETIYLNLDKHAIEALPAIPIHRLHGWKQGFVWNLELVLKVFDNESTADYALQALKRLQKRGAIPVRNASVLVKDSRGKAFFKGTEDVNTVHGALFGAIAGSLIGLVGGPAGALLGAAGGAVAGSVGAHRIHLGAPIEFFEELEDDLKPGSSAIIMLVNNLWADRVIEALERFEGRLYRQALTDEIVAHLVAVADDEACAEGDEKTAPCEDRAICLARFIARDPYDPQATAYELEEVIPRLHGVVDWSIHPDGDVAIEYFCNPVSEELMEYALVGMGYQVKHIYGDKGVDEVEVHGA